MSALSMVALLCASVVAMAGFEWVRHQQRIGAIPVRVHVNGTRGKSSVTRLIGAGLRAGGLATITKVTGTFPRLILEDGSEVEVHRRGGANILEQLGIVDFAARRQVDALVVECMALQPENQWITEHQMIHATVGVMTNIRLDHCDVMGETLPEIASVLGGTVPSRSVLFSAEDVMHRELRELATVRGSEAHFVNGDDVGDLRPEELSRFEYLEHGDNVALALAVCEHLGVDRNVALGGMASARPDAGALTCCQVETIEGHRLDFWNAFAANDPDSTLRIWRRLNEEGRLPGRRMVLLNCRADRSDRSRQLVSLILDQLRHEVDVVLLMGDETERWAAHLRGHGMAGEEVEDLGAASASTVVKRLLQQVDGTASAVGIGGSSAAGIGQASVVAIGQATVVAIGNMGGQGAATVAFLEDLAQATQPPPSIDVARLEPLHLGSTGGVS